MFGSALDDPRPPGMCFVCELESNEETTAVKWSLEYKARTHILANHTRNDL